MAESRLGYMLLLENDHSNDYESVRVELHHSELIVRRDASRRGGNRTVKNGTSHSLIGKDALEKERTVVLKRESSGLGISVKGGSENKIPVLISKIYKGQAADKTGKLKIGDIILKVDGKDMRNATHDDVVEALKNGGNCVTLVVRHLKAVTPYLRQATSVGSDEPQEPSEMESSDKSPETSSARSSSSINETQVEEINVPLDMASLSQYKTGEDTLRDGFEVISKDEKVSVTLYSNQPEDLSVWYKAVKNNIIISLRQTIRSLNSNLPDEEKIVFMNWVWERCQKRGQRQTWSRKLLVLKGNDILLFDRFPNSMRDWLTPYFSYSLIEIEHNVCKPDDLLDKRRNCFTIETVQKRKHYLSVDMRADLLDWTTKITKSVQLAVLSVKEKIYHGSWSGTQVWLHLDIEDGLKLYTGNDKTLIWSYKFSQLRSSSDDGNDKLTLKLQQQDGDLQEIVIKFTNMREVMLALLAFYSAKLYSMDPTFIKNL